MLDASLRRCGALLTGALATLIAAAEPGGGADVVLGFPPSAAAAERRLEQRSDADLAPAELSSWMEQLTRAPNHVGSVHDKANAEFLLKKFREWGWDASIEEFTVLYPTPRQEAVELVAPTHFAAKLREPQILGDGTSEKTRDELPPYNVYGADGDCTAELVYVNHGMPDDYKELERRHLSVKATIVITPYVAASPRPQPNL